MRLNLLIVLFFCFFPYSAFCATDPKIMVVIPEQHVGGSTSNPVGETEIIKSLIQHGYVVVDQKQIARIRDTDKIREIIKGDLKKARELGLEFGADILIVGEASSENAGQVMSGLFTGRARLDARAILTKTGEIIAADGKQASGVDITENFANKKALQSAGGLISDYFIDQFRFKVANRLSTPSANTIAEDSAIFQGPFPKAKYSNPYAVAVIIANKNYISFKKGVPDVDYALNDANAIYRFVNETLGIPEGNIIFLKDATQADLIATFGAEGRPEGKLYNRLQSGKSDVFVYYSGHGAPSLNDGKGYLLPVDADSLLVELNGYSLETLYSNLSKLPRNRLTLVIDACFSGGFAKGTIVRSASSISLRVTQAQQSLDKAIILTATAPLEVASWDEEARHGLFTRFFLEGAMGKSDGGEFGNSDGKISLSELKNYMEKEVTYSARRFYNREQHPQISGRPEQVIAEIR